MRVFFYEYTPLWHLLSVDPSADYDHSKVSVVDLVLHDAKPAVARMFLSHRPWQAVDILS